METPSYLFMSRRKKLIISSRIMEKHSSSDSNISEDSLEKNCRRKVKVRVELCNENVDTILVPFYENDVLIKVPKGQKKSQKKEAKSNEKLKKEWQQPSYLVNKGKMKNSSYLEIFRKQFSSQCQVEKTSDDCEISSLLPEVGDTEIESIGEEAPNPVSEYFDTEAYNETFYDKLLNKDISMYIDQTCEEGIRFSEDVESKSPDENEDNNLRSVSEITHHRRPLRRGIAQPIPNVKLGGLGPDTEKIKPRLERARSLQRYSEKVRMENRLKIYKKSVQADEKKADERRTDRGLSSKRRDSSKESRDGQSVSYLVNKTKELHIPQINQLIKKIYDCKSKSADIQRTKERVREKEKLSKDTTKRKESAQSLQMVQREPPVRSINSFIKADDNDHSTNETSITVKPTARSMGINTDVNSNFGNPVPPVQISFLVNVGGARTSTTLKTLEDKHRMYQEQVKAFTLANNNI